MENNRKGYKGFGPGLVCRGKQYAENTVFEEPTAEICRSGMHYCTNPLDVLDHYPLIGDNGELNEFAEVEALDEPKTDDGKKFCTTKLKIGAKLTIPKLAEISGEYLRETIKEEAGKGSSRQVGGYSAKQVGGDSAQQVGGNSAKQVGGDSAKQVGGYSAQQVGGDYAQQGGGDSAQQVGGDYATQVGGNSAQQVGGDYAKQVGGYSAQQVGGDYAQQVGGYSAKQVGGSSAQQVGGDSAQQVGGGNSVMMAGEGSVFKAGLYSVILRYWYGDNGNIAGFKAVQVDGEQIKADTWYKLKNGEFVEVQ